MYSLFTLENIQEDEKQQLLNERMSLDREIKNYQNAVQKINEEELMKRRKHQDDLKYQIAEKDKQRQRENQEKLYQERAAKLWELQYQKKINDQKELHMQRV